MDKKINFYITIYMASIPSTHTIPSTPHDRFVYLVTGIGILWVFSRLTIGLNIVLGSMVMLLAIYWMDNRAQSNHLAHAQANQTKLAMITPQTNELQDNLPAHKDMVDMLYSIQDMRPYNPLEYDAMLESIGYFFDQYTQVQTDQSKCYLAYERARGFKDTALNCLKSLIFGLPWDIRTRDRLNGSVNRLDLLMSEYLDQIRYMADDWLYRHGYDMDTKIITYGADPANHYDDMFKPYSDMVV